MSAVLEQYFQFVVVDKIEDIISRRFQEMKDDLEARYDEIHSDIKELKKLKSSYDDLRIDIEGLKKQISTSGQAISGTIEKDIKELLEKVNKKTETVNKQEPVKKTTAKKAPAKKKTTKK